ncbi:hypothetical protein HA402_007169 [Bradysia odoriphaga]|nr:hypothetical protein HA402_007169 [Bradysia odoriphaga]
MAVLQKLSIRGVRSFGTDPEDEQKITFTSPLTLILGENGSGKTTIIECLKYALTGECPTGTDKGKLFVHDPKIFSNRESLAKVKLQIRNGINDLYTVTRGMKSSEKNGKSKFETIDNSIVIERAGRNPEDLSYRGVDVNTQMCLAMGVSQAVISNVLFCHQEESSWPLDTDKKLKEKFDAIFGTTEYNKAIDKLIKHRKTYMERAKVKEVETKLTLRLKRETEGKMMDLKANETKLAKIEDQLNEFLEEVKPIEERMKKIQQLEWEVSKIQEEKVKLTTKIEKCKEQQVTLSSKIKTKFDGSFAMLDREIRSFKEKMNEKKENLATNDLDLDRVKQHIEDLRIKLNELDKKRMILLQQRQKEQELLSEQFKLCTNLYNRLNIIVDFDSQGENLNMAECLSQISQGIKKEEASVTDLSKDHEKVDDDLQLEVDQLREKQASVKSHISSEKKQIEELKQEQKKGQDEIEKVEKSAESLKRVMTELAKVSDCYDKLTQTTNLEEMKRNIDLKRKRRNELQTRLDAVDQEIVFLTSISKTTAEISAKESQLDAKETEARKLRNKHSENLKRLFHNETVEVNYERRVQTVYQNCQRDMDEATKNTNRNQQKMTELQIMRKNQKEELSRLEKELTECDEKIYDLCHGAPFPEVLERVKENVAKYQLDHGAVKSSEALYKKYISKLDAESRCPLCHTELNDSEDLSTELSDKIRRLPESIKRTELTLKSEQKKLEQLLSIQPMTIRSQTLKTDIPKMKEKLKETEERLSNARNDAENLQLSIAEPKSNIELASIMLGDMSVLDKALKDITRFQQELNTLKASVPQGSTTMTMDEAQKKKAGISTENRKNNEEISALEEKHDSNSKMLNTLREKRNKLKDDQIKLQEDAHALPQMKARQQEIFQQIQKHSSDLRQIESSLEPINRQLTEIVDRKERIKNDNRKILIAATKKLNDTKYIETDLKRCSDDVQKLAELRLEPEIERLKISMKKYQEVQKEKSIEHADLTAKIEQLRKEISGQELIERNLQDNKELKTLESEQQELQALLDEQRKNFGEMDFESIQREKKVLKEKDDTINRKRSECVGQKNLLLSQKAALETELNKPDYKNAVKNHLQAIYEVTVLKKIISDLGQYRMALESALLKYHSEKMNKINRLIRELWRSIYRGNDIDYVQIQTNEMKNSSADTKRSYDYRVVQSKNDVEIDMRGRCSAGQRVLACLIIRIALAETFSANCGVLALDEPTTNLDHNNIVSLCEALNKIVEERQGESSFMLLIITHDEEFISTLGSISTYYKVARNSSGKSQIQKVKLS